MYVCMYVSIYICMNVHVYAVAQVLFQRTAFERTNSFLCVCQIEADSHNTMSGY
jgi:hypothetical protein